MGAIKNVLPPYGAQKKSEQTLCTVRDGKPQVQILTHIQYLLSIFFSVLTLNLFFLYLLSICSCCTYSQALFFLFVRSVSPQLSMQVKHNATKTFSTYKYVCIYIYKNIFKYVINKKTIYKLYM